MTVIDIRIKDDNNATVNIKNDDGVSSVKTIPIDSLVTLLSKKANHFDTGIMPPNLINYVKTGLFKIYHIFVPSHSMELTHLNYFGESSNYKYMVKLPSMLFSFGCKYGSGEMIRPLIHILDTENYNANSKLWNLHFNNYSTHYGICWGDSKRIVTSTLLSDDINEIAKLPALFFSSQFNSDLRNDYRFKDSFKENVKTWMKDKKFRERAALYLENDGDLVTAWLFKYMYDNDLSYVMSTMIDDRPTHINLASFIATYNNSFITRN